MVNLFRMLIYYSNFCTCETKFDCFVYKEMNKIANNCAAKLNNKAQQFFAAYEKNIIEVFIIPNELKENASCTFNFFKHMLNSYLQIKSQGKSYIANVETLNSVSSRKSILDTPRLTQFMYNAYLNNDQNQINHKIHGEFMLKFYINDQYIFKNLFVKNQEINTRITIIDYVSSCEQDFTFLALILKYVIRESQEIHENRYYFFLFKFADIVQRYSFASTLIFYSESIIRQLNQNLQASCLSFHFIYDIFSSNCINDSKIAIFNSQAFFEDKRVVLYNVVQDSFTDFDQNCSKLLWLNYFITGHTYMNPKRLKKHNFYANEYSFEILHTLLIQTLLKLYKFTIFTFFIPSKKMYSNKLIVYTAFVTIYYDQNSYKKVHYRFTYKFECNGYIKTNNKNIMTNKLIFQNKYELAIYKKYIKNFENLLKNTCLLTDINILQLRDYLIYDKFSMLNHLSHQLYFKHAGINFYHYLTDIIDRFKNSEFTKVKIEFYHIKFFIKKTIDYNELVRNSIIDKFKFLCRLKFDDLTSQIIENLKTVLIDINFEYNNNSFQYYIILPIQEQLLINYVLLTQDYVYSQNVMENLAKNIPMELQNNKDFIRETIWYLIVYDPLFYNARFVSLGINNCNMTQKKIKCAMYKQIDFFSEFDESCYKKVSSNEDDEWFDSNEKIYELLNKPTYYKLDRLFAKNVHFVHIQNYVTEVLCIAYDYYVKGFRELEIDFKNYIYVHKKNQIVNFVLDEKILDILQLKIQT